MSTEIKNHPYHLVDPSPWPLFTAGSSALFVLSLVSFLHNIKYSQFGLFITFLILLSILFCWWSDVIKEAKNDHAHNQIVQKGLKLGFIYFIFAEAMLFFAFFWAFFHFWFAPIKIFDTIWQFKDGIWPPEGIKTFDPWGLPLLNTVILMLSGYTASWAHDAIKKGKTKEVSYGLILTICLGLLFSCIQFYEYGHATFAFKEEGYKSFYSTIFYMLTGFHGLHVICGTLFLFICLIRNLRGSLKKENHLSLDFAAWYWHFVDVIWIGLFVFLYILAR